MDFNKNELELLIESVSYRIKSIDKDLHTVRDADWILKPNDLYHEVEELEPLKTLLKKLEEQQ